MELFEDPKTERSSPLPADDASLVMRVKEDYDGAEPSGNSVASHESAAAGRVHQPRRIPRIGGNERWPPSLAPGGDAFRASADAGRLRVAAGRAARDYPGGPSGATPGTQRFSARSIPRFVPNRVAMLVDSPETRRALAAAIPSIEFMQKIDGRASAYVCRNYTCQLPANEADKFAELIQ